MESKWHRGRSFSRCDVCAIDTGNFSKASSLQDGFSSSPLNCAPLNAPTLIFVSINVHGGLQMHSRPPVSQGGVFFPLLLTLRGGERQEVAEEDTRAPARRCFFSITVTELKTSIQQRSDERLPEGSTPQQEVEFKSPRALCTPKSPERFGPRGCKSADV